VDELLDEDRPLVGAVGFAYDRSKADGERAVMDAVKNGLDALVISPTAIIGPADPQPSLTGKALIDLYHGKIPSLVPGGYDWVDVRDVVNAAISAITHGRTGEKYILSGQWHSLKELSELVQMHTGRRTVSRVLPMWLARVGLPFITLYSRISGTEPLYTRESLTIIAEGNRKISNDKARRELNFQPRPLTETIKDFTNWLKENDFIR
jgi:dihydroflavonol-4-reductase